MLRFGKKDNWWAMATPVPAALLGHPLLLGDLADQKPDGDQPGRRVFGDLESGLQYDQKPDG
ncbi:MAG: hypothetical protein R2854_00390 [Caldilineaceae bacterium]